MTTPMSAAVAEGLELSVVDGQSQSFVGCPIDPVEHEAYLTRRGVSVSPHSRGGGSE